MTGKESGRSPQISDHWAHQRGLQSELVVEKHFLAQGYQALARRLKTPYAEIDLLFRTPESHLLMVEVKTVNIESFQPHRVSWRQKQRQLRALQFLIQKWGCPVEVNWAFVTKKGELTLIEDITC